MPEKEDLWPKRGFYHWGAYNWKLKEFPITENSIEICITEKPKEYPITDNLQELLDTQGFHVPFAP